MVTGTTDWGSTPPAAQDLARMLQRSFPDLYTRASYVPFYPAKDDLTTLQLRSETKERVVKVDVEQYVKDMKNGDEFPPGFACLDMVLDGLHRLAAVNQLRATDKRHPDKWTTFHMIVFDVNYAEISAALKDQFTMLVGKVNRRHGARYTKGEIEKLVASLVGNISAPDIARTMGINVTTVKAVLSAKKTRDKARELGLDTSGIARSTAEKIGLRMGNSGGFGQFTEPSFAKLVELANATPITTAQVVNLMDRMETVGTEAKKAAMVDAERSSRAGQEKAKAIGIRVGQTPAQQARDHWAFFLGFKNDPSLLVETNELKAPLHMQEGWEVVSVLRKFLSAQAAQESDTATVVTE